MISESRLTLQVAADLSTSVYFWEVARGRGRAARGIVQLVHGSSEHVSRYAGFAEALCQAGYDVVGSDHRGHGQIARSEGRLGKPGADGWNGIVRDLREVSRLSRERFGQLPLFLVGHSMGTLLARDYSQRWGADLAGLVLASPSAPVADIDGAIANMRSMVEELGAESPSPTFEESVRLYNAPFEPAESPWAWFSRDEGEVRKFHTDPLCGFTECNGFMLEILQAGREVRDPRNQSKVPRRLPMLILAGDADPAVDYGRVAEEFAEELVGDGFREVRLKRYAGARHQLLFETNREAIFEDIVEWLNRLT